MKIILDNPLNEPITDLAIANCIRNYITDTVYSDIKETICVDGEEYPILRGNEPTVINSRILIIASALIDSTKYGEVLK